MIVGNNNIDLATIKALMMDVDGVLTDAKVSVDENGVESRNFSVRDGLGIRLCQRVGIKTVIITSSPSKSIEHRGKHLGIDVICLDVKDKAAELVKQTKELGLQLDEVAYVGDDLIDIGALTLAGLAVTVSDAESSVLTCSDIITINKGGNGAIREICEMLVESHNTDLLEDFKLCGLSL